MELLIQRSLPDLLSVKLSLLIDLINQQYILCGLSNCCSMWKSSPNDSMKILGNSTCKDGDNKLNCYANKEILPLNSEIFVQNTCAELAYRWKGFIYKRKKLRKGGNSIHNNAASKWGGFVYRRRNLSSSSSNSISSSNLKKQASNSKVISAKPLAEINSGRDFCTYILKMNGLLVDEENTHACKSSELKSVSDANSFQSCEICEHLENPSKMLICDICEGAFHLSCYNPRVKKLPVEYWFCQPCYRKKSKALLIKSSENLADILNESRNYRGKGGPIICMIRNDQPFISRVRIGEDYQAEVSDWNGPISEECANFSEHLPMIHSTNVNLNAPNNEKTITTSFIGNWIQCRDVILKSSKDNRTICGKWRRAPLFVVQTDKWDCSCCVLWDPLHADCAVPQELETDVILDQLKYLEMLKPRLTNW